jgi:hypothetical protein
MLAGDSYILYITLLFVYLLLLLIFFFPETRQVVSCCHNLHL